MRIYCWLFISGYVIKDIFIVIVAVIIINEFVVEFIL